MLRFEVEGMPANLPPDGSFYATRVVEAKWKAGDIVLRLRFVGPWDAADPSLFRLKAQERTSDGSS